MGLGDFIFHLTNEAALAVLGDGVDAAQKCVPGLHLALLDLGVLLIQGDVGGDVHGGVILFSNKNI